MINMLSIKLEDLALNRCIVDDTGHGLFLPGIAVGLRHDGEKLFFTVTVDHEENGDEINQEYPAERVFFPLSEDKKIVNNQWLNLFY